MTKQMVEEIIQSARKRQRLSLDEMEAVSGGVSEKTLETIKLFENGAGVDKVMDFAKQLYETSKANYRDFFGRDSLEDIEKYITDNKIASVTVEILKENI